MKNGQSYEEKPFFSIITCTLNSASYLSDNIRSVEEQTFTNYEHIFVDSFSEDSTLEIIKGYQLRHPDKVNLFQRPANGVSDAMNYGASMSRGEVLLHLHSDDYLAAESSLQIVKDIFLSTESSIVIGNCKLIGQGTIFYTWPTNAFNRLLFKMFFNSIMFYTNLIPHPSTYIRKSIFEKYGGFDVNLYVVMDYDFWFRVLKDESFVLTDKVLSAYRFHIDTVSTKQMNLGLDEMAAIQRKYRTANLTAYAIYLLLLKPLLTTRRLLKSITAQLLWFIY